MARRARIFVDYWNFQLNWNERSGDARCDWLALPEALISAAEELGRGEALEYAGTHIYASVDQGNDNLLNWLETFLERQPGFHVRTVRLTRRQRGVRCSSCGDQQDACPECGEPYTISSAKGLTTSMVCDMLSYSHLDPTTVPVVVSSDTELLPALAHLEARGAGAFHAGWRDSGLDLTRTAWGSIDLDGLIPDLIRA